MSAFKDAIAADIHDTFLNALEFADLHNINGTDINCVVDENTLEDRSNRSSEGTGYVDGVFVKRVLLFVAESDLPRVPVRGELLRLDGERYLVDDVATNAGVLEIRIEANEQ